MKADYSTQSITWFRNGFNDGTLVLRPPYQRKPVWTARQRSKLIESILWDYPIPEIFIHVVTVNEHEVYNVVDGQQRIRTVLQFIGTATPDDDENGFTLTGLDPASEFLGRRYVDLTKDQKDNFRSYRFAARQITHCPEDQVRQMFARMNEFQSPATAQEVRHAIYTGPFAVLSEKLADDSYWAENHIVTPASIRRMGDVEYISELLIGVLHGPQGKRQVTDYYRQYEDFDEEFPNQKEASALFDMTLQNVMLTLADVRKEARWSNKLDFYSLFVAIAHTISNRTISRSERRILQDKLRYFAGKVDTRLRNEHARASKDVIRYVRAVEKGGTDKARRSERHEVLCKLINGALRNA